MSRDNEDRAPHSAAPTLTTPGSLNRDADQSSAPDDRFPAGCLIANRFRIVGHLGGGGMGEVYRADDLELGTSVALKFLPFALAGDPVRLERLRNEVRVARRVAHPNVCRVYDIGDANGRPFLSMEYIDGEDLASLLRRIGRLPRDKAMDLAREICAGVAAAHELGVVHRDLKPANVMIDGRGRARVADFGLASAIGEIGHGPDVMAGTPVYMAPEQFAGGSATKRTDIYALGLVLYELFTGKRAHDAKSLVELKEQLSSSAPPTSPSELVEGMDPQAERVIMHCLESDPDDRPASALSVMAALPGGDPLAAMLKAGEIPSPELVAASGRAGTLSSTQALRLAGVILVGLAVSLWLLGSPSLVDTIGGVLSPEVLTHRAKSLLTEFGFEEPTVDSAWGHDLDWELAPRLAAASLEQRRQLLRSDDQPPLRFWFRSSPEAMIPWNVSLPGVWAGNIVTPADPPLTSPGMKLVRLGPRGNLLELRAAPDPSADPVRSRIPEDLIASIARAAGLDPATTEETSWSGTSPMPGEATSAFLVADQSRTESRIIVTTLASGQLTWAKVIAPGGSTNDISPTRADDRIAIIYFAFFGGGALLAAHNLRKGQLDRRGAARLAAAAFMLCFASELIGSHHTLVPSAEVHSFFASVAYATTRALMTWLLYVAIEPLIRKLHPRALVSWSRLLAGRISDPAVGRDVLAGLTVLMLLNSAFGIWFAIRGLAGTILPYWAFVGGQSPLDTGTSLAIMLRISVVSVGSALGFLLLYVAVRRTCGALTRLATGLFWILLFGFFFFSYFNVLEPVDLAAYSLISSIGCVYLAVRHGLLALATSSIVGTAMMFVVLTLNPGDWFFPPTAMIIVLVCGLTFFGWKVSADRPVRTSLD